MFSSEIWRSVASNHYLELGQILNGAQINLLPGERVLRISITNLLIFPCADPLCVRGVFMWTPQRKRRLQHTHTHLFMLADTRWHRHLQNAHIGIFSDFRSHVFKHAFAHTVSARFLIQNHAEIPTLSSSLHSFSTHTRLIYLFLSQLSRVFITVINMRPQ